jgi:hypothetical protein
VVSLHTRVALIVRRGDDAVDDGPPVEFSVPSDTDAITSAPAGRSRHLLVTANRYADNPRLDPDGAIVEETSASGSTSVPNLRRRPDGGRSRT